MCANGRDRDVCFAREFTAILREMRLLVEPAVSWPQSFNLSGMLSVPSTGGRSPSSELFLVWTSGLMRVRNSLFSTDKSGEVSRMTSQ